MFPFLVGCPRSGTTLLRAMLDGHSAVAVPGESHFIPTMAARRERYEGRSTFDVERFVADLGAEPRFSRWDLPAAAVRASLLDTPPVDLPGALRRVYELYAVREGKAR